MTTGKDWEQRLLKLIAELSTRNPRQISDASRLREDLGFDSVSSMELVSMLSEEFGLDVSIEEATQVTTVGGAIELTRRHLHAETVQ